MPTQPDVHDTTTEHQQDAAKAHAAAVCILREHLQLYLERNGRDATFVGWISHLHPENVRIDERLLADCEHRRIWLELTDDGQARPTRSKPAGKTSRRTQHRVGLVDSTCGAVFMGATLGSRVALGATRGVLHVTSTGLSHSSKCMAGLPLPVSAILRVVGGSLAVAEVAVSGAEVVAVNAIAVAGGATCGLLALSAEKGRATHARLRATRQLLKPTRQRHRCATCDEQRPLPSEVECAKRLPAPTVVDATYVVGVPIPVVDAVPVK